VEASRGEQLERGLLDVPLGTIELLKEEKPSAVAREDVRRGVFGTSLSNHRQSDEVRRLEEGEVEDHRADAERVRDPAHNLALADAGGTLKQNCATRPVR
jgi:hypothetical protein